MPQLNEQQLLDLRRLRDLSRTAFIDLHDSIGSGMMSDSKSSVYAVMQAAKALDMSDEVAAPLRQAAHEAWQGAVSIGEAYDRAAQALAAIGNLQRAIAAVYDANGLPG
jgi:hypothetical protein